MLDGSRPHEGAQAAPDLQQVGRDETAERLSHGRPADAVASHELQLRLDLAAGGELTPGDALAQVLRRYADTAADR